MSKKSLKLPYEDHAAYWKPLEEGRIQCLLCPHNCRIAPGERGDCYIRGNDNGKMRLFTYGLNSGPMVDPIEKKPLYHFFPGTKVLSFGTAGCNLSCGFCQNWTLSAARDDYRAAYPSSPQRLVQMAEEDNCISIAYTYNEPIVFFEYAMDTAFLAAQAGLFNVAVSNGYIHKKPAKDFYNAMDAANIDLKAFQNDYYEKYCGGKLNFVLKTLEYIKHETNTWLEITTLLIPGLNDSKEEITRAAKWIYKNIGPDTPLHYSAFFPNYKMMDIPPTPLSTLTRARKIAMDEGIQYVYTGNLPYEEGENTYCPNCHKIFIERRYRATLPVKSDECSHCHTRISGRFLK